jgi:Lar family restriction alleviation protein
MNLFKTGIRVNGVLHIWIGNGGNSPNSDIYKCNCGREFNKEEMVKHIQDLMGKEEAMTDNLKPCPFCGEKEDIVILAKRIHGHPVEINGHKYWRVECLPCDAKTGNCFDADADIFGFKDGREMAIARWNRRT